MNPSPIEPAPAAATPSRPSRPSLRTLATSLAALAGLGLAACGGGGGGGGGGPAAAAPPAGASCDLVAQKEGLRSYMAERYYWTGLSPSPDPAPYTSLNSYFNAQLHPAGAGVPADRWSYLSDTASYEQFFAEGRTLGYGLGLGLVVSNTSTVVKVRSVEPKSPSGLAGIVRGDTVVSVNGLTASVWVERGDLSALTPTREGEAVTLVVTADDGGNARSIRLTATTFDLTPVPTTATLTQPDGRKVGYVVLKDFITQAEGPLRSGIAQLKADGARDLVLDLRYNGGGRVSTANLLASLIAGSSRNGQVFTELRYNSRQSSLNTSFRIDATDAGFERVVVLTGSRTCSASELVVNGLKPFLPVSTVGGTTCGKPFGFNPADNSCGTTISAVNFESFNAAGEGRYYDGIGATCGVADRFTGTFGRADEALTAGALSLLANGRCPATASGNAAGKSALSAARSQAQVLDLGERPSGMRAD